VTPVPPLPLLTKTKLTHSQPSNPALTRTPLLPSPLPCIATQLTTNRAVTSRFPGATVTYGSAASGQGDNREIPVEEGGSIGRDGQLTKARDFEGVGGPEDKERLEREVTGGDDGVGRVVRG